MDNSRISLGLPLDDETSAKLRARLRCLTLDRVVNSERNVEGYSVRSIVNSSIKNLAAGASARQQHQIRDVSGIEKPRADEA